MKRILLLIKGLGRGGAEQLLASAAPYRDASRFEYEVAYLLPWKNALVSTLESRGVPAHCLEGGQGAGWVPRLRSLVRRGTSISSMSTLPMRRSAPDGDRPRSARLVYTEHNMWGRYRPGDLLGQRPHVSSERPRARSLGQRPGVRPLSLAPPRALPCRRWKPCIRDSIARAMAALGASDGVRDEFGIPDDAPLVGKVANFKPHKGHTELIRAVVKVRRAMPEVRFMLVGVGPLEAGVRADAERLGVEDAVIFAGFRDDVPRISGRWMSSRSHRHYEGLSIALIEAMALGKAVVVTRAGGHAEVVSDRQDGLLVPTEDVPALADGLITVLEDGELRDRLGVAARRRAEDSTSVGPYVAQDRCMRSCWDEPSPDPDRDRRPCVAR